MPEADSSWIKPGVDVVVLSTGGRAHPRLAKVKSVASKSFTIEGIVERISLDKLESKSIGGTWSSWRYRVVRPASEEADRAFEIQRVARLKNKAHAAAREWMLGGGSDEPAKADAVIAAFQSYLAALGSQKADDDA